MDRAELKETVVQLEGVQQREAESQPPEDKSVFQQPLGVTRQKSWQAGPGYALLQLKMEMWKIELDAERELRKDEAEARKTELELELQKIEAQKESSKIEEGSRVRGQRRRQGKSVFKVVRDRTAMGTDARCQRERLQFYETSQCCSYIIDERIKMKRIQISRRV